MIPVIALVGRANVGKSTLFNRLTGTRDALVADYPGLTRDRIYGTARVADRAFVVIDTGGMGDDSQGMGALAARQAQLAVNDADAVVFLVDGREGITAADEQIAQTLRRAGKPVKIAVNKAEGSAPEQTVAEFYGLGLGAPMAISATRGEGIDDLVEEVVAEPIAAEETEQEAPAEETGIKVAVIGRPNVGKSTLVNRLIGDERMVAAEEPGTTRDSIRVTFERDDRRFTLIDTAGIRRRGQVTEDVERLSVVKSLQAIEAADVVIAVLDAREGVVEQDARLLGHVVDSGRALVLALNKWDGLAPEQRKECKRSIDLRLAFVDYAPLHFISALHGSGIAELMTSVEKAYQAAVRDLPTAEVTQVLHDAVAAHAPPLSRGRRIKLRYAHQGGTNPPVIVVHGTQANRLPAAYRRYLANKFRDAFKLTGTPMRVVFRTPENPYEGRARHKNPKRKGRSKPRTAP